MLTHNIVKTGYRTVLVKKGTKDFIKQFSNTVIDDMGSIRMISPTDKITDTQT